MSYKIIDVERRFTEVFETIPQYVLEETPIVRNSSKLYFGFGEQKELDKILILEKSQRESFYPLLWLNFPYRTQGNRVRTTGDYNFVLATNTKTEWGNQYRFSETFRQVLYPNFDLVMQALQKSKGIQMNKVSGNYYYDLDKYPNYGVETSFEGKSNTKQVDYWDAIKFKVNLTIDNDCIGVTPNIQYDTNNLIQNGNII